jgi:hypothetical protein
MEQLSEQRDARTNNHCSHPSTWPIEHIIIIIIGLLYLPFLSATMEAA